MEKSSIIMLTAFPALSLQSAVSSPLSLNTSPSYDLLFSMSSALSSINNVSLFEELLIFSTLCFSEENFSFFNSWMPMITLLPIWASYLFLLGSAMSSAKLNSSGVSSTVPYWYPFLSSHTSSNEQFLSIGERTVPGSCALFDSFFCKKGIGIAKRSFDCNIWPLIYQMNQVENITLHAIFPQATEAVIQS